LSTICYFSGTGNNYHVASLIAGHEHSELVNMADFKDVSIHDDSIGIITPVYCGELPQIVRDFLKRVILRSDYIWALAVSGGTVGTALLSVDKLLRYNDLKLSWGGKMLMPDNSLIAKQSEDERLIALDAEIENAAFVISRIEKHIINKYPVERFLGHTSGIQWFFLRRFTGIDRKKADSELCTKCGTCIRVCPLSNISFDEKGEIKFGKNCTECFACMHRCPQGALRAGHLKFTKDRQYVHPQAGTDIMFPEKKKESE
jgi:ferredoxin